MKKLIVLCLLIGCINSVFSQDISKDEISVVAYSFLKETVKNGLGEINIISMEENDTTLLFLAHDNNNFILIANDLRVQPILGYTNEGTYKQGNMPPQLVALIESYKNEILTVKRGIGTYKRSYKQEWERYLEGEFESQKSSVEPIIKVNWNQGERWNRYCPEDPEGPGGRVYAGCVAVSMAQSMSVFKHPDVGVGESSYMSDYGLLKVNPGETEYNWDLMSSSASDEYNSLLIYHCAVTVEMGFGPYGSGAYTTDIAKALKTHFDYSSEVYSAFSTEDEAWVELLKSELDKGRPISYGGNDGSGTGHAFNLDGYNGSSAFHVNWGWSGSYNGYFQITSLTPGGSDYSKNAKAVLNIKKMDHSSTDIELTSISFVDTCKVGEVISIISTVDPDQDEEFIYGVSGQDGPGGRTTYCPFFVDGDSLKLGEMVSSEVYDELHIKITSEELSGEVLEKDFTIEVLNDNNPPTGITISNDTFDDTLSIGSFIATFEAIDSDDVDTFTYELAGHTNPDLCKDNEKFVISNDSLLTNFDFSEMDDNICVINVKTTDHKGESITESFNLNINLLTSNTLLADKRVGIELFPNPVKDRLIINSTEKSVQRILIYNLIGSTLAIYGNKNNQEQIEIFMSDYTSGYYLVQVELMDGSRITSKILKK